MGTASSKAAVDPTEVKKFDVLVMGYAKKIIGSGIPQEIVTIIVSYGSYDFIDYNGKFIENNVGKDGMSILSKSNLSVVCKDKGRGASAKMDKPLPKIGSNISAVYVWKVRFIDNYSRAYPIYFKHAAFIGIVSSDCQDFNAMIIPQRGYYGRIHKVLKNATGITCDGNVYIDSKINNEIKNGKQIKYNDIVTIMYYVGDGMLVFMDDEENEFCRIPLQFVKDKDKSYFPVVSHINNANNMDIITFDINYSRQGIWDQ